MSLSAMSFRDGSCMSTKDRTGGGEWGHLKGANNMVASGLMGHFCHPNAQMG